MSKRDYYEVLKIDRGASEESIRNSYRKLAREYHPDVNKAAGAEEKFKEIQKAYEVLSDPQKKAVYDQYGDEEPTMQGFGSADFGGKGFGGQDFGFGDIFDMFFGGAGRSRGGVSNAPQQGPDLEYRLELDFRDAVFGKELDLEMARKEVCSECKGSGAKKGTKLETCSHCNGSGQSETVQKTPFGRIVNRRVCSVCGGRGKRIRSSCPTCNGAGEVEAQRILNIKIPSGIDNGSRLRIAGEGGIGKNGGSYGDLYVVVLVREDEFFKRKGFDLLCDLPITFAQAALGDEVLVPTLRGKAKLKVPAGTQTGTEFRLAGQGVPKLRGNGVGNLLVKVHIVVPSNLTEEQREALRAFNRLCDQDVTEYNEGFFDKVKRALNSIRGD
ncbi:MAG: molecular chaperone DnaJ [Bacillota bacterium]